MSPQISRLLFTSTYSQPYLSGITEYIETLTEFLAQTYSVTLVSFQHASSLPLVETMRRVKKIRIPVHFKLSKGFINFWYPWEIYELVKDHDHIFINSPQVEGIFVALAAKFLGKKLTVIHHCELFFESDFKLQLIALVANFLSWLTVGLSDQTIAYTQDYAEASPVLRTWLKKVVVVSPPVSLAKIDTNYSKKIKQLWKNNFPILGFSGRISREKGLDYLLTAVTELRSEFPQINLYCTGTYGVEVAGEAAYFEFLKTRIAAEKLPVTFLSRLTKSQLTAFYENISVLILPSVNKTEAFGLVQAEALLAGTPVIATNLPGVRDCVSLTGCGKIVAPKNSQQLVEAIREVVTNIPSSKKITAIAKQHFDAAKTLRWFQAFVAET